MNNKELVKPHISKLPITEFPEYRVPTDSQLAISIPLFYSAKDSGQMVDFDVDRFKEVHVKGAIWTAISIINNTDLVDRGVGIYFHVEETMRDDVSEVMQQFNVPPDMILYRAIDASETTIDHTQYGKKLMCVDEDEITTDRWLIFDTDAFICSMEKPLLWYDKLTTLDQPATLNFGKTSTTTYEKYVSGVCISVGIPFDPTVDHFMQEQRAFHKMGFSYYSHASESMNSDRPYVASQITLLPKASPIFDFLKKHYTHCYQDEFLMGAWDVKNNQMVSLSEYLNVPVYYYVDEFIERNINLDNNGYVLHFHPKHSDLLSNALDPCYDALYNAIKDKKTVEVNTMPLTRFSDALQRTTSDKHTEGGHKYGLMYDMIIDSLIKRQGRPVRILEVGVSFFGQGSLNAYKQVEGVDKVVGIDLLPYDGQLSEGTNFHQVDNAYTNKVIDNLRNAHGDFDLIIDDGSHDPKDQEFFINNYYSLLANRGMLVVEDIYDAPFFQRMCKETDIYGWDGWSNINVEQMTDYHNERLLIREKNETFLIAPNTTPIYQRKHKQRFHLPGIAYGKTHKDFSACAFVQKTRKGGNMLDKLGHEVYHYGHDASEVQCTEHITTIDDTALVATYGTADYNGAPDGYNTATGADFITFDINTEREIRKRYEPGDFVLLSFAHNTLKDRLSDLDLIFVEWGIGYQGVYSDNTVYESSSWQNFQRGKKYPEDEKEYLIPDWRSAVIPNYFDPSEFTYREDKEDYVLYIGRVTNSKGIQLVFEACRQTNTHLIVAGPDHTEHKNIHELLPPNAEYVGITDSVQRDEYMSKAKTVMCPSLYLEPFLGTHIEPGFCGTPIITTNWGPPANTCLHGVNGFKCQTGEHMVWALENIDQIKPIDCYNYAYNNFSMDRVSISYHEYFDVLYRNIKGFFWDRDETRNNLDWLRVDMSRDEIEQRITEIQQLIKQ